MFAVVGDAVKDLFALVGQALGRRQQAAEIYPADHMAVGGVNAGDTVGVPDIGINLAIHPLELVQVLERECRLL